MFAQLPHPIMVVDREYVCVAANAAFLRLTGSEETKLIGKNVFGAFPNDPRHAAAVRASFDRVCATRRSDEIAAVTSSTTASPQRLWSARHSPVIGDDGEVAFIIQEASDVTHLRGQSLHDFQAVADQIYLDRQIAEARRMFLLEVMPVQVWSSTPDGKLDFVNERVVSYFQRSAEQILGDGWLAVLHPDDTSHVVERWTRSLATGEPYEVEFRLRRGDGEYRWHLGRANAERDAHGTIKSWVGTNTDVHDAKSALAELTARSQYEQRLIGIVSHDLRNPASAIALGIEILASRDLDPASRQIVERISRAAERSTRLVDDLLDFAKQRIGATIPVVPMPANLKGIVTHVIDELATAAPGRVIHFEHSGEETGAWDADRLAQVISNLVGNALQHGHPEMPIRIDSRIAGSDAVLTVANQGPAITPEDLPKLFEPYKRGSAAREKSGMGLGLFIAREVIAAHGGTIGVESASGETRFTVRLPRFASHHSRH